MKNYKTIDNINKNIHTILLRLDLNVPIKDGVITGKDRIEKSIPTIKELLEKKLKIIILTHLGRPKGTGFEEEFSLKPVCAELENQLGFKIPLVKDINKEEIDNHLKSNNIVILENIRFFAGETKNNENLSKELASLGDAFVLDAFSCAHRAHSSTVGITEFLPSFAGRLMEKELDSLSAALINPKNPSVAIVGGAKISTKIDVLKNLSQKLQYIIIGGGMANTFLYAQGFDIGKSLCEKDMKDTCNEILSLASKNNCKIILPQDALAAQELKENSKVISIDNKDLPDDFMFLDAGPKSIKDFENVLSNCKTLLWNGPLGAFEVSPFNTATFELAKYAAKLTKEGKLISIAGGGDTVAALESCNVKDSFTYVSTAGGAFLEFLEGKTLPALKALEENSVTK